MIGRDPCQGFRAATDTDSHVMLNVMSMIYAESNNYPHIHQPIRQHA